MHNQFETVHELLQLRRALAPNCTADGEVNGVKEVCRLAELRNLCESLQDRARINFSRAETAWHVENSEVLLICGWSLLKMNAIPEVTGI